MTIDLDLTPFILSTIPATFHTLKFSEKKFHFTALNAILFRTFININR